MWWRKSRRSEAGSRKEREKAKEIERKGGGWGGEGKEKRTSYF
jgi:hypothetical protein